MLVSYQDVLDQIFRPYMRVQDRLLGKHDREARNQGRIMDLVRGLGLMPPYERCIRVTGSKGKGTTARMASGYLQGILPEKRVALFVSPHEFEHTDRMLINGSSVSKARFVCLFNTLLPDLKRHEDGLQEHEFLSPMAFFLIVALQWFKEENADFFVLETGRGVRYDEVAQIPSKVSVVTSILFEHAQNIGPGLEDIARDKLSISLSSDYCVFDGHVAEQDRRLGLIARNPVVIDSTKRSNLSVPAWIDRNSALAKKAVCALMDRSAPFSISADDSCYSASFGLGQFQSVPYAFEALINLDSADPAVIDHWAERYGDIHSMISLPDDKDRGRIFSFLAARTRVAGEVILEDERKFLHYSLAEKDATNVVVRVHFDDADGLADALRSYVATFKPSFLYFAGTQSFIRLLKRAVGIAQ
jgi:hypothetical protein